MEDIILPNVNLAIANAEAKALGEVAEIHRKAFTEIKEFIRAKYPKLTLKTEEIVKKGKIFSEIEFKNENDEGETSCWIQLTEFGNIRIRRYEGNQLTEEETVNSLSGFKQIAREFFK